jgi:hypothetical protein
MNKNVSNKHTLFFLHLPKTAGTTLTFALIRKYGSQFVYRTVSPSQEAKREFINAINNHHKTIKVVAGHMYYGWHTELPNPWKSSYITMLRNPVDRIISTFFYIIRSPGHYLHDTVKSRNIDLETFVDSDITSTIDNLQTRLLAGSEWNEKPTSDTLDRAIRNIDENISFAGLTERFDESLVLLKHELKWESYPYYIKQNVTDKRPVSAEIPEHITNMIKKRNKLDFKLYAYVKDRFNDRLDRQRSFFEIEVKRFTLLNLIFSYFYRSKEKFDRFKKKKA